LKASRKRNPQKHSLGVPKTKFATIMTEASAITIIAQFKKVVRQNLTSPGMRTARFSNAGTLHDASVQKKGLFPERDLQMTPHLAIPNP
jgi:hypothetical protein